jgi:sulfatase maturation enzyme AslB (radical SAM superfamily)
MNNLVRKISKALVNLTKETIKGEWHTLAIDITNLCNLRCPFCYNDWLKKEKPMIMKKEIFSKIVEIMPIIHHQIYLSCSFEPTLHPRFVELLNMIPFESRKKCFFTTNLSTKISDDLLEVFSHSGLKYINISLDSFNPIVYEKLRKGAHFKDFISNLNRLVAIFSKNPHAPSIRYITMVFKQNIKEIPDILEQCHKKYLSSENEFRNSPDLPLNKWPTLNNISDGEWTATINSLNRDAYPFSVLRYDKAKVNILFKLISKFQLQSIISIDAGGAIKINNKDLAANVETISNPLHYFKKVKK